DETWKRAQDLKAEKARLTTHLMRRPAHLLCGLLRRGCCGSGMSVHDRDKTGKTRIRCSAVRESGSCSNHRIFYLPEVEKAVIEGMAEELEDPRLIPTSPTEGVGRRQAAEILGTQLQRSALQGMSAHRDFSAVPGSDFRRRLSGKLELQLPK